MAVMTAYPLSSVIAQVSIDTWGLDEQPAQSYSSFKFAYEPPSHAADQASYEQSLQLITSRKATLNGVWNEYVRLIALTKDRGSRAGDLATVSMVLSNSETYTASTREKSAKTSKLSGEEHMQWLDLQFDLERKFDAFQKRYKTEFAQLKDAEERGRAQLYEQVQTKGWKTTWIPPGWTPPRKAVEGKKGGKTARTDGKKLDVILKQLSGAGALNDVSKSSISQPDPKSPKVNRQENESTPPIPGQTAPGGPAREEGVLLGT